MLPWYLRKSPTIFLIVAAIKLVQAIFAAVGAQVWANQHGASADQSLLLGYRVFDAALYSFGWVASAIMAKLVLVAIERVGAANAQA